MSFLFAISAMAIAIMFPVLLSLRTSGVAGVSRFSLACGLAAASICIAMFDGLAPRWLSGIVSVGLMIGASLMTLSGFRQFFGRPDPDIRIMLAAAVLPVLGLAFFSYGVDMPAGRGLISGATIALIFVLIAATILAHGPKDKNISTYMIVCFGAACGIALFHMLRVFILVTGVETLPGFADPRLWTIALPAVRILFLPLFFLSIILMVQGRMIAVLRHTVAHDDLTGVLSRPAFMARLQRTFEATMRFNRPMAFLLLDLDRFKQINDRYGHAGGDAALKHFADVVGKHLDGHGYMGRLGGEEFGIVLPGVSDAEAVQFAETLCAIVRMAPIVTQQGATIWLTVSTGIAMAEQNGTAAETMIRADTALYEAKAGGRDCHVLADRAHGDIAASTRALNAAAAQMRIADAEAQLAPAQITVG
ncbi:diguanylate cyclase [Rhizobium sp. 32-5/1]|uniref:GGDEF domain-containing protein n=1 Tax=Rhizobium sp. 32-5/1 TaxID=3019602 RepID=UPI00240E5A6B|nr:diguanylate cyclase [Rhizobium sp. 32-5/1]WEZ83105.1 diguanylate cyclase [Rhizobium sp. 32-5/1]